MTGVAVPAVLRRQRWWLGRLAVLPLHLLLFTVISFLLVRSVPGDPVRDKLGQQYDEAAYLRMQAAMGLDGSPLEQLGRYLGQVATFDLGNSLNTGRPVADEIGSRLFGTVELALMGLGGALLLSLAASYLVVTRERNPVSRAIRAYSRAAGAVPEYVLAVIGLIVLYSWLGVIPAPLGRLDSGLVPPNVITGFPFLDTMLQSYWAATVSMAAHLALPVAVMAVAQAPILVKLLVSGLEEAVDAPPTRFRIASGASRPAVLLSVYRRALPPVVTMCGTLFGYLLGGAVVLETLFGFAGMGQYAVDAVTASDHVALQGFLIVIAALALLVFLAVDLLNMVLDPRRRPGSRVEA
ncbi:ABC transporter permease [Pseudonocardia kongjuensis]|uniref:ABC transporter permease n=1 Tax=Pseudonocardia kongjuensis TaxID=102227 RepID=A0ABN1XVS7_9PSEU